MIVTLLKVEGMHSISLPEKIKGQYWIADYSEQGGAENLISVEGISEQWMLKSNKKVKIIGEDQREIKETALEAYHLYRLLLKQTEDYAILFVEPVTDNRKQFNKYKIRSDKDIYLGRTNTNQIIFYNMAVSSTHAKIYKEGDAWCIQDEHSTNGIYVNNRRVMESTRLQAGDVIFIMGLKIIMGRGFLAVNNPDQQVVMDSTMFLPFTRKQMQKREEEDYEEAEVEYFYRSPRFKREIKKVTIKVDPPTSNQQREEMPLMMAIGPSLTMGLASLTTGLFAVMNAIQNNNIASAIPSIVMSFSMLIGTVLWPVLARRYEKKRSLINEAKRQAKYKAYLDETEEKIDKEAQLQATILRENYLTAEKCENVISTVKSSLWEREIGQSDFLNLLIGTGDRTAEIQYQYQERRFVLEDDNLQRQMLALCETPKMLNNVPIVIHLMKNWITGVVGAENDIYSFARSLLLQMLAYYSYDEFKIVMILPEKKMKEFENIQWIPHIWEDEKRIRFIARNFTELKTVSAYMEQVVVERSGMSEETVCECVPYYVVMVFDRKLANKAEMLKQIYHQKRNLNVSVVTFLDQVRNLPKECSTVIELQGDTGYVFNKKDITGLKQTFRPSYVKGSMGDFNMQLANVQLDLKSAAYNLPQMITFLELYQVGKVEHLNALSRWRENDPTMSLEVPVGVDPFGEIFRLDLHEKYHGPHGLVAGMTGSGKSEFIMTYILSLALNYHPYEVGFILIDYKGGGMAKAFEHLPHTRGIITNLDGAAVKRSLVSIQSELKRRQAIFVETGKQVGESNLDIYKYQKLYREGIVTEPLQHLFIISDEFAELKSQQEEFMEQLISAARIGRSLGVHLILATQKPAGVVNDQIWSNSKFKVCLKVQDRADSMEMLKRPDAAELSDTGRFYLQVGYNELFELGQSAWAGAPYYPSDQVMTEQDDSVEIFDMTGHVKKQIKPQKQVLIKNPSKQLDVITEYLRQTAENEKIAVKPLWLPPIPQYICIRNLEMKYHTLEEEYVLNPVIGEYDDPARQQQCVLRLPITYNGNTVVYGGAGMGKTTFLNAMLYSLTKHHGCGQLNLYILDFSSESLRAFQEAPQVGDVIVTGDDEKIENLFKMMRVEVKNRKQMFGMYGGDMQSYIRESGKKVPNIVIVINNFATFMELYDSYEDDVVFLSREGTKYGIYFVITAINTNDVRYRVLQNFNQQYVLQLNDSSEYTSVLGNVNGVYPSKCKGRGIFKQDEVYEFQIGYITEQGKNLSDEIQRYCQKLKGVYGEGFTKGVPTLPEKLTVADVVDREYHLSEIPIGISKADLKYVNLCVSALPVALITGFDLQELISPARAIVQLMAALREVQMILLDPNARLCSVASEDAEVYTDRMEEAVTELFQILVKRHNLYKQYNGELPDNETFYPICVVIQNYQEVFEQLSEDGKDKLKVLLEKNEMQYKVHVVICEEVGNLNSRTIEAWFKRHLNVGEGVFIGNGIANQYVMKVSEMNKEIRGDIPAGFGYVVQKGTCQLVKLIMQED